LEIGRNGVLPDRGDGACALLEEDNKTCSQYDNRPDICNVGKSYAILGTDEITEKEWFKLNNAICNEMIDYYQLDPKLKIDIENEYDE